jgi:outer membrane protein assembly factor BamD (BamD/ComL family)
LPWWKRSWGSTDTRGLFEQGKADALAGNNRSAASALQTVIKNSPNSAHREEAMWLRANALFAMKQYYQAFEQYEELLTQYAGSPHYRDALLKEIEIAELFLGGERRRIWGLPLMIRADSEGLEILRKVYEHQPAGDLAAKVVLRIAEYHWTKNNWLEAEDYYDKYCREYPNTEAAPFAELRRAKCALERCQGARYDTTCLQLAYDRLKQFEAKFPDAAEKENVAGTLAVIRSQQAEALYQVAARYHRASQPLAAAFYAERLRERFPDSPWNEAAAKFMAPNVERQEPDK